jgi:hypothetical protein
MSDPDLNRPFANLPLELFRGIIQNIQTTNEFCLLARVCRVFQLEAERIIYRSISPFSNQSTIQLCRLISTTPRLGRYVINFDAHFVPKPRGTFDYACYRLISRALRRMTGLQSLTIMGIGRELPFWIFEGCKFNLIAFIAFSFDTEGLIRFLSTQTKLVHLELGSMHPVFQPSPLPSNFLPELHSFRGFIEDVECLVPSRSMSLVNVWPSQTPLWPRIEKLAQSSEPVKALWIRQHVELGESQSLSRIVPKLERLSLHFTSYDPRVSDAMFICVHRAGESSNSALQDDDALIALISSFRKLSVLEIFFQVAVEGLLPFPNAYRVLLENVVKSCPSLRTVMVHDPDRNEMDWWIWEFGGYPRNVGASPWSAMWSTAVVKTML